MAVCLCGQGEAVRGPLCADTLAQLASIKQLTTEQILSAPSQPLDAALVDAWGRLHKLESRTVIGRQEDCGIVVLDGAISRTHAEVTFDSPSGRWILRDLGSTNGTYAGDQRVETEVELHSGDIVFVGPVGFVFAQPISHLPAADPKLAMETVPAELGRPALGAVRPTDFSTAETTFAGLPSADLVFTEPTGGGGGYLEWGDKRVQLTVTQYELLTTLARRMWEERLAPELVRGFVRSAELLPGISWDTAHPEENHLKQLIRRVRRSLVGAGFGNLVESRHRFGYRLRLMPVTPPPSR